MFVLVLLLAVAGGGAAYWFYSRSDEELRQLVLYQLRTMAPTLKFDIARAHGEMYGRIWLYGLTIRLPDDNSERPTIEIPEAVITLDPQWMDLESVVIQKLRIIKPKVRARREIDFTWNLQQVAFQTTPGTILPEVEIEHGSILVDVQLPERPSRKLLFKNFNVSATPKDARRLAIQVGTLLEPAGPLTLEVDLNLDGPTWACVTPDQWRVPVDSGLIQLLCDLSPDIRPHVVAAGQKLQELKAAQLISARVGRRDSDSTQIRPRMPADSALPNFGVKCDCGLKFEIARNEPGGPLAFSAVVTIENGKIENDLLPFPLHELRGKFLINNREIIVSDLQATNGPSQISISGDVIPSKPIEARVKIRGVEIDDELKARLPESLRKKIMDLGLTGVCDADLTMTQEGSGWRKEIDLHLVRGTITDKRFPVTVRNVVGELHQRQNVVTFNAKGLYARRPVTVNGTFKNPGPDHEAEIFMASDNLPLDDELIAACPVTVGKTIEALRLNCRHNVRLTLRTSGPGKKYEPELIDTIYDGSMSYKHFPYEIKQLTGIIKWTGDVVEFRDLAGVHDGAKIKGFGAFRRIPDPGRLDLSIDASDASFEESLRLALPPTLKQVWTSFQPKGNFDIRTQIAWVPGEPCEIRIPSVNVRDGVVLMNCFPWPLQNLKGEFSYNTDPETEPGKLVIKEVYARHDDCQMRASGFGVFNDKAPWRLKFDQFNIDDLVLPNATFRNSLPGGIQQAFDTLRPTGNFSLKGPVEFFGPQRGSDTVCALWNLHLDLLHCGINAGTAIEDINGEVLLAGQWDGRETRLNGDLKLDSIWLFRNSSGQAYQVTGVKGPFRLRDGKFVAGTEAALPERKGELDKTKRIRGEVIDGTVFFDSLAFLGPEPEYHAFIELEKGKLEQFARRYLRGQSNLAGVLNGWMRLEGKGSDPDRMTGKGFLRIAPASLYELPLFVQMFRIPQLRVPDRTAFDQAELQFNLGDGKFDFNSIELLGEAVSLRGRGYVRFDGSMDLKFGSQPSQGPRRVIQDLFRVQDLKVVRVTGNIGDPKTIFLPEFDEGMRQFFGAFNPQMPPPNARFNPRTGQSKTEPVQ